MSKVLIHDTTITHKEFDQNKHEYKGDDGGFFFAIHKYELNAKTYSYIEVLFRQLMIDEQMGAKIRYENDSSDLKLFCGNLEPEERVGRIEKYLGNISNRDSYAFQRLTFEKKSEIKKLEIKYKQAVENIEAFKKQMLETVGDEMDLVDITNLVETTHKNMVADFNKNIKEKSFAKSEFVKINDRGEILVNPTRFHFFKFYCLIYSCLMEQYVGALNDFDSDARTNLNGFIGRKLIFEFQGRLGFRPTSGKISQKISDSKTFTHVPEYIDKIKIIDVDFCDHIRDLASFKSK
ncbi:MAG: hypothetical protein HOP07_15930 [Bacteriovoracaceae bacterium]|nr:hypothetical protein [Bacteriovoracaceae bacterium]